MPTPREINEAVFLAESDGYKRGRKEALVEAINICQTAKDTRDARHKLKDLFLKLK